ncbi:MAG: hypothetical protein WCP08_11195 [Prolixibacteraceae bacterium]
MIKSYLCSNRMTKNPDPVHAMKTETFTTMEKKLFPPSLLEMANYALLILVLLNGIVMVLYPLILKTSYTELFKKTWIILIFTPLLSGIMQAITNRDGILTLKGAINQEELQLKLAALLKHFDYVETQRVDQSILLDYRTKWKRFMHFYKGQVLISIEQDEIHISGKKLVLDFIETKLMLGKTFKAWNVHKLK